MPQKLVINIFGSPGAGKTVAASSIFAKLKKRHVDALLVSEFAKDMVVEDNKLALKNQLYVWASQQYRIFCAHEHADVVVTDSPILLGMIYQTEAPLGIRNVILDVHHRYDNLNILVELDPNRRYSMVGRVHTLTESVTIHHQIVEMLDDNSIPYMNYADYTEDDIADFILTMLKS